jgi:hypothetical protein
MHGARHPFTGWLYEPAGDGTVKVTDDAGREGFFDLDGRWLRGTLREADGQVCHWVGGPTYANHRLSSAGMASG